MSKGVSLIAIRYARSLVALDEKRGAEERVSSYQNIFKSIEELFAIREAIQILKSPVMPKDLKFNLLNLAFGGNVDEIFKNFVNNLIEANRIILLPEIGKAYESILMEKRNEQKAKVLSARVLSDDHVNKIEKTLGNIFHKKIILTNEIDKKLLGGFVVKIENYILDYSLLSFVKAFSE